MEPRVCRDVRCNARVECDVGQVSAVEEECGHGEQQEEEEFVVSPADAVVDPNAVMVGAGDAVAAQAAMLGAGGFGKVAGAAVVVWVEEYGVVGVVGEVAREICRGYDVRLARAGAEVGVEVGLGE